MIISISQLEYFYSPYQVSTGECMTPVGLYKDKGSLNIFRALIMWCLLNKHSILQLPNAYKCLLASLDSQLATHKQWMSSTHLLMPTYGDARIYIYIYMEENYRKEPDSMKENGKTM